jgi:hypothetical protein
MPEKRFLLARAFFASFTFQSDIEYFSEKSLIGKDNVCKLGFSSKSASGNLSSLDTGRKEVFLSMGWLGHRDKPLPRLFLAGGHFEQERPNLLADYYPTIRVCSSK